MPRIFNAKNLTLSLAAGIGLGAVALIYLAATRRGVEADKSSPTTRLVARAVEGDPDAIELPELTIDLMRLKTLPAKPETRSRRLELRGSLAIDANKLVHVHTRFPGQVVEIATVQDPFAGPPGSGTVARPLTFMDRVSKGDRLAVLWSKDVGEKKSELVDAIARLRIDKQNLKLLRELEEKGATSASSVRDAELRVQTGEVATRKFERTLRSWELSEAEIAKVEAEAERISRGEGNNWEQDQAWARVDLTAPIDGTLVEKNITVGDIIDPGSDVFKIADLSVLSVWLHAYEEDLPFLQKLPKPLQPLLRLPANPELGEIQARIDRIGEIIDPNEHMALLLGSVVNPNGDLRAGQFVTANLDIPPELNSTQVPANALLDEADKTYVFVQLDGSARRFQRRRVAVTRRHQDLVDVRSVLTPEQAEQGIRPLVAGEVVVVSGAIELAAALNELAAQRAGEK